MQLAACFGRMRGIEDSSAVEREMNFCMSFSSASVIEIGWLAEEEGRFVAEEGFMFVIEREFGMRVRVKEGRDTKETHMAAVIYRYSPRKRRERAHARL